MIGEEIKWREKTRVLTGPWPFLYSVVADRKGLIRNVPAEPPEEEIVWRRSAERKPAEEPKPAKSWPFKKGPKFARKQKKNLSP